MNKVKPLLIICLMIANYTILFSQESATRKTIIDHFRIHNAQLGRVRIFQSPLLDSIMSGQIRTTSVSSSRAHNENISNNDEYITMKGYRIQIFSGNNQRVSKNEAYIKEQQIKEYFPLMDTYVSFHSPFWKLRIGNYRTAEEAHAQLRELKQIFPNWKEMFIVRENIKVPTNTTQP